MFIDTRRLRDLGWDLFFDEAFRALEMEGVVPARVAMGTGADYVLYTDAGELRGDLAGRLRGDHVIREPGRLDFAPRLGSRVPTVGDWVAVRARPREGRGTIQAILPRRTAFSRKAALQPAERQVLAANVDTIFVVVALRPGDDGESARRVARHARSRDVAAYLAMAHESGAQPVILLTKADLCADPAASARDFAGLGVDVHVTSAVAGDGLDALDAYLAPGRTVTLIGLSGVGKSTLINALLGEERLPTREVRRDGDGRHTTARRELIQLPGRGMVIDTPGLREIELWDADGGIDASFADIEMLAAQCRFRDCRHAVEPGCAVLEAIDVGALEASRLTNRRRLERELERLERKQAQRGKTAVRWKRRALARTAFDERPRR